jgi:hypothetical protein
LSISRCIQRPLPEPTLSFWNISSAGKQFFCGGQHTTSIHKFAGDFQ